jgi:hypothetical protein
MVVYVKMDHHPAKHLHPTSKIYLVHYSTTIHAVLLLLVIADYHSSTIVTPTNLFSHDSIRVGLWIYLIGHLKANTTSQTNQTHKLLFC